MKKITQLISILLLFASFMSLYSCTIANQPQNPPVIQDDPTTDNPSQDDPGQDDPGEQPKEEFTLTAQEFVNEITVGINLGNTLDSYYKTGFNEGSLSDQTIWGNPATRKDFFKAIKDLGFNTIRIPVTWGPHFDPTTKKIENQWAFKVNQFVDYAIAQDLKVIINVHHDTQIWLNLDQSTFETTKTIFKDLWEQIATRYKDYGEKLIFEGFNEILDTTDGSYYPSKQAAENLNELNQIFVDTVRATGSNNEKRYLICSTYFTHSNGPSVLPFVLPTDTQENKLIVQVHNYQTDQTSLEYSFAYLKKSFIDKGIPVIVGECGIQLKTDTALQKKLDYATLITKTVCEAGCRMILWETGNTSDYQIMNRSISTCRESEYVNQFMTERAKYSTSVTKPETEYTISSENLSSGNWALYSSNDATVTKTLQNGVLSANVTNGGAKLHYVQAYFSNISLTKGKTYRITFTYSNDSGYSMPVMLQKNANSTYICEGLKGNATNETFVMDVHVTTDNYSGLGLMIYIGGQSFTKAFDIQLTRVEIYELNAK